jgi:hypothetical protein
MRALVVYESMFGNTKEIAEAVAAGLADRMDTEAVEVGAAPTALSDDLDLLVVGGPTHTFGMSRPATRRDAARQLAARANESGGVSTAQDGIGMREWLASVDFGRAAPVVAVFDTRMRSAFSGSAAVKAERLLRRRGMRVVARRSFFVTGGQGPLRDGERDQARWWAADVATWRLNPPSSDGDARNAAA